MGCCSSKDNNVVDTSPKTENNETKSKNNTENNKNNKKMIPVSEEKLNTQQPEQSPESEVKVQEQNEIPPLVSTDTNTTNEPITVQEEEEAKEQKQPTPQQKEPTPKVQEQEEEEKSQPEPEEPELPEYRISDEHQKQIDAYLAQITKAQAEAITSKNISNFRDRKLFPECAKRPNFNEVNDPEGIFGTDNAFYDYNGILLFKGQGSYEPVRIMIVGSFFFVFVSMEDSEGSDKDQAKADRIAKARSEKCKSTLYLKNASLTELAPTMRRANGETMKIFPVLLKSPLNAPGNNNNNNNSNSNQIQIAFEDQDEMLRFAEALEEVSVDEEDYEMISEECRAEMLKKYNGRSVFVKKQ